MLEFIVLGQIPGTGIYLSFTTVAICFIALIASCVFSFSIVKRQYIKFKTKQDTINNQAI